MPQREGIPFAQRVAVQMGCESVENMVEKAPSSQEALPILRHQVSGFGSSALTCMSFISSPRNRGPLQSSPSISEVDSDCLLLYKLSWHPLSY